MKCPSFAFLIKSFHLVLNGYTFPLKLNAQTDSGPVLQYMSIEKEQNIKLSVTNKDKLVINVDFLF